MMLLGYAPDLVEEAVLLAEPMMPGGEAAAFRRERDRHYAIADQEMREASFRSLHRDWFSRLGLNHTIEHVIGVRPDVTERVPTGRVVKALTRNDEAADLVDLITACGQSERALVLRLLPASLVSPGPLPALLHHELTHVADMLDPSFGYQRRLLPSEDGPVADRIIQDRYRVLWDTTIDGRLVRRGLSGKPARARRWREFDTAFSMLGDGCRAAFERWFAEAHPMHAELVAFATEPQFSPVGQP